MAVIFGLDTINKLWIKLAMLGQGYLGLCLMLMRVFKFQVFYVAQRHLQKYICNHNNDKLIDNENNKTINIILYRCREQFINMTIA